MSWIAVRLISTSCGGTYICICIKLLKQAKRYNSSLDKPFSFSLFFTRTYAYHMAQAKRYNSSLDKPFSSSLFFTRTSAFVLFTMQPRISLDSYSILTLFRIAPPRACVAAVLLFSSHFELLCHVPGTLSTLSCYYYYYRSILILTPQILRW